MATYIGNQKVKWYLGNKKVKKVYRGADRVYSAGNIVTYIVDRGISYQEEADSDASCLSPKTFTPSKSGWTFIGWRQDTSASGSVLSNKIMGDDPVTLYAVFRQTVTVTYYNGTTTASSTSGYKYYNNGNIVNPTFTISQTAINGWTARGWSTGTAGNAAITYSSISNTAIASSVTLYGMYQQTITVTYYNGSATAATTSGYRYYNSGSRGTINPTFSISPATISGWTFYGWTTSTAAGAAVAYSSIANREFSASTIVIAGYYQQITLSYNGNGNTGGSIATQVGTRYWNALNILNPTFNIASNAFTKSGYSFVQWHLGSTSGTAYQPGASVTLSESSTMYAQWLASTATVTGNESYVKTTGQITQSDGTYWRCGPWYSVGEDNWNGSITVNYNEYKIVTIVFWLKYNQTSGELGKVWINGVQVCDCSSRNEPSTYTYTGSATSIPIQMKVRNDVVGSWSDIRLGITSVTMSI